MAGAGNREDVFREELLQRLLSRVQQTLSRQPLDLDFLEFVCSNELALIQSFADQVETDADILQHLNHLLELVQLALSNSPTVSHLETAVGFSGRSRLTIKRDQLEYFLESGFSVPCIAKLLGVSPRTIFQRMEEFGLSVRAYYSTMTDTELDNMVRAIKIQMPNAGYRTVKGQLMAMGSRVQWERIKMSMHRVDAAGVLSRLARLGCVVRRSYSVQGPLALVHVDTNHKLIRYNLVIFGGVDGFSRKVMYLDAATNNRASTAFSFFLEAIRQHGIPSRVRGDQGVENLEIAYFMFSRRGTGRASFISGKSMHNQRIERLWRDVWMAVNCIFYEVLHTMEENGVLDISNVVHIFCVHYIFLPRLQAALKVFTTTWNNHPLRREGNHSPEQLWCMGRLNTPQDEENVEELQYPETDWEDSPPETSDQGIQVPAIQVPLTATGLTALHTAIDPLAEPTCDGRDLFMQTLDFIQHHTSTPVD